MSTSESRSAFGAHNQAVSERFAYFCHDTVVVVLIACGKEESKFFSEKKGLLEHPKPIIRKDVRADKLRWRILVAWLPSHRLCKRRSDTAGSCQLFLRALQSVE